MSRDIYNSEKRPPTSVLEKIPFDLSVCTLQSIDKELIMYTFLAVGKRTAYVILLSYFVSRVVISIGRFNDKEVKYIHWYITVSFAYQVGSEHVHV